MVILLVLFEFQSVFKILLFYSVSNSLLHENRTTMMEHNGHPHSLTSLFQKCAGFDEHQGLRQKICMNAKDTASLCWQILSLCCFDIFVYNSKCKQ